LRKPALESIEILAGEKREMDRIRRLDKAFAKFSDEYLLGVLRGMCAKDQRLRQRIYAWRLDAC
jgi:hypothetical protein